MSWDVPTSYHCFSLPSLCKVRKSHSPCTCIKEIKYRGVRSGEFWFDCRWYAVSQRGDVFLVGPPGHHLHARFVTSFSPWKLMTLMALRSWIECLMLQSPLSYCKTKKDDYMRAERHIGKQSAGFGYSNVNACYPSAHRTTNSQTWLIKNDCLPTVWAMFTYFTSLRDQEVLSNSSSASLYLTSDDFEIKQYSQDLFRAHTSVDYCDHFHGRLNCSSHLNVSLIAEANKFRILVTFKMALFLTMKKI